MKRLFAALSSPAWDRFSNLGLAAGWGVNSGAWSMLCFTTGHVWLGLLALTVVTPLGLFVISVAAVGERFERLIAEHRRAKEISDG